MLLATGSTLKALTQESRCAGRVSSIQATLSTLSGVDTWCGSTVMLRKPRSWHAVPERRALCCERQRLLHGRPHTCVR